MLFCRMVSTCRSLQHCTNSRIVMHLQRRQLMNSFVAIFMGMCLHCYSYLMWMVCIRQNVCWFSTEYSSDMVLFHSTEYSAAYELFSNLMYGFEFQPLRLRSWQSSVLLYCGKIWVFEQRCRRFHRVTCQTELSLEGILILWYRTLRCSVHFDAAPHRKHVWLSVCTFRLFCVWEFASL